MTYQFYKDNIGKLTKKQRGKYKSLGLQLKHEEWKEEYRQTGISSWRKRAEILNDGDTVGLLYDTLQTEKDKTHRQGVEIRMMKEQLKEYRDKEPWHVGGF